MSEITSTAAKPARSAGIIVARRRGGDWRLLVLRAFRNWDFPKGLIEAGEDPLDAAKRETTEETGIEDLAFDFGESFKETLPYANGKIARYYLAITETAHITLPISHELGKPEHDEWRWVTFDEAEDVLPPRLAAVLEWARNTLDQD